MCGCLFRTGGSCGTGGSVMDITYPLLIPEDIAQLQAAEKAARDKIRADRIRMLRFLSVCPEMIFFLEGHSCNKIFDSGYCPRISLTPFAAYIWKEEFNISWLFF